MLLKLKIGLSSTKTKNNFSYIKTTVGSLIFMSVVFLFLPFISKAQIFVPHIEGLGELSLEEMIVNIIQISLGFLGLIALIIILYGGFIWMTSGGNEEKITKAKDILKSGIIGLVIILASYIIASFVLGVIQDAADPGGGGGGDNGSGFGPGLGSGALGGGVIESHYPRRDADDIPRNTMIMISFKIEIATSTIVGSEFDSGLGQTLCNNYTSGNNNKCGKLADSVTIINDGIQIPNDRLLVVLQEDGQNILINPLDDLGTDSYNTDTLINLSDAIQSTDGDSLFGSLEGGYSWNFEVSTFLDNTPPKIDFVWPIMNDVVARNAIMQITFSEPINILSLNGNVVVDFREIENPDNFGSLEGQLKVSNQYKTVEFFVDPEPYGDCGGYVRNSCGEQVFCLPAEANIQTLIKAGDLLNLASGINDAAGNFLDGNDDGLESGSPNDDYAWDFETNNEIDLTPPKVISIFPSNDQATIRIDSQSSALFDKVLSSSSIKTDNFYIYKFNEAEGCAEHSDGDKEFILDACFPNYSTFVSEENKKANIRVFSPYLKKNSIYRPRLTSEIKDSYGNCYNSALGPGRSSDDEPNQL
ncbi:Ig-like domain-containing protein [bacterium]|nr:Ig-like domain-containing protein [bacterium]